MWSLVVLLFFLLSLGNSDDNCDAGYYERRATEDDADCQICPPAYYCLDGKQKCPKGHFCPDQGMTYPFPAPEGFFCPGLMMTFPIVCKDGKDCSGLGTVLPSSCPPTLSCVGGYAHACPLGACCEDGLEVYCSPGTYLPTSSSDDGECVSTLPGYFCPIDGCYSETGRSSDHTADRLCPAGMYCLSGCSEPELCPAGFFCPLGSSTDTGAGHCEDGYFCPPGSSVSTQLPCPDDFQCVAGVMSPVPHGPPSWWIILFVIGIFFSIALICVLLTACVFCLWRVSRKTHSKVQPVPISLVEESMGRFVESLPLNEKRTKSRNVKEIPGDPEVLKKLESVGLVSYFPNFVRKKIRVGDLSRRFLDSIDLEELVPDETDRMTMLQLLDSYPASSRCPPISPRPDDELEDESDSDSDSDSSSQDQAEDYSVLIAVYPDLEPFVINPERVQMGALLAQGAQGTVTCGVYTPSDLEEEQLVAVKEMLLKDSKSAKRFLKEIRIQSGLKHCNVLSMVGFWIKGESGYVVTKLCHGDLFRRLHSPMYADLRLSRDTRLQCLKQIAGAILYLHSQGIVHRDLKSQNILIDSEGYLKVADFGFATHRASFAGSLVGTPEYLAPEALKPDGNGDDSFPANLDVYSFGVLMWEIWSHEIPFYCLREPCQNNPYRLLRAVHRHRIRPSTRCVPAMPLRLRILMTSCWAEDPKDRPRSFEEILDVLEEVNLGESGACHSFMERDVDGSGSSLEGSSSSLEGGSGSSLEGSSSSLEN